MKMFSARKSRPTIKPFVASSVSSVSPDESAGNRNARNTFDPEFTSYTGVPRKFDDHEKSVMRSCNNGQGITLEERKRMRDERAQEKKEKKHKPQEVLPSNDEISSTVFYLFAHYEFITLVDIMRCLKLSQESNKAKTAVKNVLKNLAIYEPSGPNKRKYKLREECKVKHAKKVEEKDPDDDINWESDESEQKNTTISTISPQN